MKNIAIKKNTWKYLGRSNIVWLLGLLLVLYLMINTWKASLVAILLLGLIFLISRNDTAINRGTYIKFGLIFYIIAFIVIPISSHSNDSSKNETRSATPPTTTTMSGITPAPTATSVTQTNTMTNNDGQSTASSTSQIAPSEKPAATASSESNTPQLASKEQTSTTHKQSHNTAHSTHKNEISKHSNGN
ncbi:hypothetical protein HQN89_35610 [Paenibacillus frigoriresistens]|uniref:hypothetical protein n=1 Tax=Paenibacillus alginolyticus TaxID=59839 RepID=UPI0015664DB9|nr:hypothetical protein [Paenibacillus frigoriresistens]NRF96126.1 hypothetical protein [Paenibacillus frigoriresistens]